MKKLALAAAALATFTFCAPAHAETTLCTEITALPFTITVQGVYCLKQNLNVNLTANNSAAITINAGNVIIDFNGWRINNQATLANQAIGVRATDRKNVTLKNGFIRGFYFGILLEEIGADASATHLVDGMKIADSGYISMFIAGDKSVVRDNRVLTTGGGPVATGYGIYLDKADDGVVSGNTVAGVSETNLNYGVFVNLSNRVQVIGNTISGIDGGNTGDRAIGLQNADHAIVAQNRMLNNPGVGTSGIFGTSGSDNISCLDNEIGGFGATPTADCDVDDGNRQLFN